MVCVCECVCFCVFAIQFCSVLFFSVHGIIVISDKIQKYFFIRFYNELNRDVFI